MKTIMKSIITSINIFVYPLWAALAFFSAGLLALPAIQHGVEPVLALLHVIVSFMFLRITVSILWLLASIMNLFVPRKSISERKDLIILRGIVTLAFILGCTSLIIFIIFNFKHTTMQEISSFLLMISMTMYFWTIAPSPLLRLLNRLFHYEEWGKKFDERFQYIWQLSAATALYWVLGLFFVFGSLYDIMVNHQWPIRSVCETLGGLLIWVLVYRYRGKRV